MDHSAHFQVMIPRCYNKSNRLVRILGFIGVTNFVFQNVLLFQ